MIEAEQSLMKVITELDNGMRTQFTAKFEEIKVEFDKVFKELFGGGRGTIELVEDEDILEAGIIIVSQPPGKKLQNMMQLSGGEKALTAIALLFAIQNLKPSPFCLLDEIEAALDDSNVGRYANYLHKLTKHTQFIVITHRRGTMAAADRLYGITMQEKGVSTLVSVDLIANDLNEPKERKQTDCVKWDGCKEKFGMEELLPLWVADMDFEAPVCVKEALKNYVDFGVYGYYQPPKAYFEAFENWEEKYHDYKVEDQWTETFQ